MSITLHNQILKIKVNREVSDEEAAALISYIKHEIETGMNYFQTRMKCVDPDLTVTLED